MTDDGYVVGYRRPPLKTRFQLGKSGNPRGRPRRSKDIGTLFERKLDQLVPAKRNGRNVRITLRELFVTNIVTAAIKGDARARELVLRHMRESGKPDPFAAKPYDDQILAEIAATLVPTDDEPEDG